MKIISWNVNGLRANVKKGAFDWLLNQDADIFCLQETKVHPDQLEESIRNPVGYQSYFDHSKLKKGYSGVAVYVNKNSIGKVEKVEYGMNKADYDQEGRFLAIFFKEFVLINCYFPNGGGGPDRLKYKLEFYEEFLKFIEKQRKDGKNIIFCGDINTAHNEIDIARPKENENNTGFLRIERDWLDKVIAKGYVDVFRTLNPEKVQYTWWDMKTFARDRNIGWRLDYFFVNKEFFSQIKDMKILEEVMGSDHCPIKLII
ncbi:MAG: exodeoxyribonuclease III [Candidatus Paceibacterota bacterium]|jgi:exodeoxyribonuclease-3